MARIVTQLIPPQQLSTGAAVLYVVPVNRSTVVTRITFVNETATDRTINLWFVPSGDTPVDSNKIVNATAVAAGESFSPSDAEAHVLPAGTTIQASAEVITAITIIGSGTEVTN